MIALCLALFLPGLQALPVTDRDEARFIQASKQMVETGDLVHIRFQDQPRDKKPIGIYWAQAASASLLGGEAAPIAAYRLPSVLGATIASLLLLWAGIRLYDRNTAFIAASLMAAALMTVVQAHLARVDAALLAAVTAAQLALGLLYRKGHADPRDLPLALLFWGATGAALLLKGPVGPTISLLTIAALGVADRSLRWTRPLRHPAGLLLMVLIVLPWTLAIIETSGEAFFRESVGRDLLPKLLGSEETHGAPPGTYLLQLPLAFFPGSILLIPALYRAWRNRANPVERFCLAWLLPSWILFELVPTKLPHYVLPLFPALALITGRFALIAELGGVPWHARLGARVGIALWMVVVLAFAASPFVLADALAMPAPSASYALPVTALAMIIALLVLLRRRALLTALSVAVVGSTALYAGVIQGVLPRLEPVWSSELARRMITAHAGLGPLLASAGYTEPSLVVAAGQQVELGDAARAAEELAGAMRGLVLVTGDQEAAFREAVRARGIAVTALDTARAFNYSRGAWIELTLFARAQ